MLDKVWVVCETNAPVTSTVENLTEYILLSEVSQLNPISVNANLNYFYCWNTIFKEVVYWLGLEIFLFSINGFIEYGFSSWPITVCLWGHQYCKRAPCSYRQHLKPFFLNHSSTKAAFNYGHPHSPLGSFILWLLFFFFFYCYIVG